MLAKRHTFQKHICNYCRGQYTRKWVLKRHLFEQHGEMLPGKNDPFTYGKQKSSERSNFLTFQYLDQKRAERKSRWLGGDLETQKSIADRAATTAATVDQGVLMQLMQPMVASMSQALRDNQNSVVRFIQNNIIIPKHEIAGFSCYVCQKCLGVELPLPIKDLGVDLTREAKHRCHGSQNQPKFTNTETILSEGVDLMVESLLPFINVWTGGRNVLVASPIVVSEIGNSLSYYIAEKFGVPLKYYLTRPLEIENMPWLKRLLQTGSIKPTSQELIEFCKCCSGTYAIIPAVHSMGTVYFSVSLKPDLGPST